MRTIALPMMLVLCVCFTSAAAQATTVRYTSLEDRVRRSVWVVHAEVVSVDHPAAFTTRYGLALREVIQGDRQREHLWLTVPGGPHGSLEMRIPGMPRLRKDSQVVLLLERAPSGALIFTDLAFGVFELEADGVAVSQPLHGLKVLGTPNQLVLPERHDTAALLEELRRLAP